MNLPFLLNPAGKDYLWGGERLKTEWYKTLNLSPLAETWECSTHPDGPSMVKSGVYQGMKLSDLLKEHPDMLGTKHQNKDGQIPILVKFIDAKQNLSLQVHPSDEYAKEHENGQLGKTEMWYVIDATEDAKLIYGFNKDMTTASLKKALEDGTVLDDCNIVPVKKGDSFLITSGTVHAICSGCLIAEIQESSNLTYRLYDYHRLGKDGKPRPLHIQKALEVADMKKREIPNGSAYPVLQKVGFSVQELAECSYFRTDRALVSGEHDIFFGTDEKSFIVCLCLDGEGALYDHMNDEQILHFRKGDCVFLPANGVPLSMKGRAEFLKITC